MSNAKVIFTLDGIDLTIQCSTEDKMRDICQKYSSKVKIHTNLLIFLFGGNQLNMELKFNQYVKQSDNSNNEMRILVYKIENDFTCPNCGKKIKINSEKIDDIISSNNSIRDTINGIKINMESIIKASTSNLMNVQLKNINILLNAIIEDIRKNNEKLKNLLKETNNMINNNLM